jgi:molybdopterin-containing oxidoreductase family iron-sulfur binding subunit
MTLKSNDDQSAGRQYWQSLNEYANGPEVRAKLSEEFPSYDPDELLSMSRRKFMQLAGASMALAGLTLTGCRRWPKEYVVPHNARPEGTMPGVPETYASMTQRGGVAHGLFVESVDGRPVYLAGNPMVPGDGDPQAYEQKKIKVGPTDAYTSASILSMYDPDRSRSVMKAGGENKTYTRQTWENFAKEFSQAKKLAVLSEANAGPSFQAIKKQFLEANPDATWTTWEPLNRDNELLGAQRAFGSAMRPIYDLRQAKVLAMFDSDLLTAHPAQLSHMRGWAEARRKLDDKNKPSMSRVYAVGPTLTNSSSNADEHLQVKPSHVAAMLDALAVELGVPGIDSSGKLEAMQQAFVERLAKDLDKHRLNSLITVGPSQPPAVHALAWAINSHLGSLGTTVKFVQEPEFDGKSQVDKLAELVEKIDAGEVDGLLILGGDPAYNAPADLDVAAALAKVKTTAHLSVYANHTSSLCRWVLPEAHFLECWGDGRAWDGTICLQQPIIEPLFEGKSPIEVLAMLTDNAPAKGYDLVRSAWAGALGSNYDQKTSRFAGGQSTEKAWREAVHNGLLPDSGYAEASAGNASARATGVNNTSAGYELSFRADPRVYDGRYANNGWLQELPEPMTKVAWDNPVWLSVADGKKLKVGNGDVVKITVDDRSIEAAAYLMPGQAPGCVIMTLGQGQTAGGRIAPGVGFDAYPIRTRPAANGSMDVLFDVQIEKTGKTHALATTSDHHLIDLDHLGKGEKGTDSVAAWGMKKRLGTVGDSHQGYLLKRANLDEYLGNRDFATEGAHGDLSLQLYDPPLKDDFEAQREKILAANPDAPEGWDPPDAFNMPHAWGMSIDMTTCTGCSACIIACQSENNIPIVGKDQVMMSREMHWLRIDTYFRTSKKVGPSDPGAVSSENLDVVHMPMMCVHCENAPCEQVCPVAATVHDTEGLNTMVYNRCIGTRYCSNNCPYKVRRFNYFDYHSKLETDMFRNSGKPGGIANMPWLKFPDQQQVDVIDQVRRMVFNPDVTVRMRGVMEKCTYCTQRIARAKIDAKADWAKAKTANPDGDHPDYPHVEDGAIVTACQGACPTQAITFGNLNDPNSAVTEKHANDRSYQLLSELNSRPRTRHMALVRNPNKKAKAEKAKAH